MLEQYLILCRLHFFVDHILEQYQYLIIVCLFYLFCFLKIFYLNYFIIGYL